MKWCLIACLLLSLLPLMVAAQAPPPAREKWSLLMLAHPDAKLLIGIDWKRVLASPVGPILQKQVAMGGHPLLGFLDSIENVERLMVSSPGAKGGVGRPPLLVVGEGRFAMAKVRAMAKADGAVSRRYNDVELLVPPDATNADLHFALLDAQTILFGDGASVKSAISRWQNQDAAHAKNALVSRAAALSATQEFWALANDPAQALAGVGIAASALAEEVESLEMVVSTSQNFAASLGLKALSQDGAETLATGLPALLQLVALQYSGQPSLSQIARRLRTVTEQNYVKIGFTLDGKLLDKGLNELRAAQTPVISKAEPRLERPALPAAAAASAIAPSHESPAPIPATAMQNSPRRVIRIVGLDEGVREIPYQEKKP